MNRRPVEIKPLSEADRETLNVMEQALVRLMESARPPCVTLEGVLHSPRHNFWRMLEGELYGQPTHELYAEHIFLRSPGRATTAVWEAASALGAEGGLRAEEALNPRAALLAAVRRARETHFPDPRETQS